VQEAKAVHQKRKTDAIALNVTSRKSTGVTVHIIALKVLANDDKEKGYDSRNCFLHSRFNRESVM
jgi:hypothetical protein